MRSITAGCLSALAITALIIGTPHDAVAAVRAQKTAASSASAGFDRNAWKSDYAFLKAEIERSYSHLAWFASQEGGVDLPALNRRTLRALNAAESDADASMVILDFVAAFHDGHFAPLPPLEPAAQPAAAVPERAPDTDATSACAAYGYAPVTRVSFSLPFESLPGFKLQSDGLARAFRSGVIATGNLRFAMLRIARFRAIEYPTLCIETWSALHARSAATDAAAIQKAINDVWLRALAERLAQFRNEQVDALIVDVAGNGGGNDLGEWSVRLFTSEPVHSARLLMIASPLAGRYFDEQLDGMKSALVELPAADSPSKVRDALTQATAAFERRKQLAQEKPCDMSWVWRERRARSSTVCSRLIESAYASGALDYLAPGTFEAKAATALYWPAVADSLRGSWTGPVYVLTDDKTASAAEMFTALIRDSGTAKTVGARTLGLGCGSMMETPPLTLPHSRLSFRLPNCVRLRADGTDEVAGIQPDIPVLPRESESPRARAARALAAIGQDLVPETRRETRTGSK